MSAVVRESSGGAAAGLSIVRGDPAFRIQRAVGLLPQGQVTVARRALFFALVAWAPSATWALLADASGSRVAGEPVLRHFGVHFGCLVVIPLLILAEALVETVLGRLLPQFPASGVVPEAERTRFAQVLRDVEALRDRWLPWALIGAIAVAVTVAGAMRAAQPDAMNWATHGGAASLGFGGWWFLLVARPLVTVLLLAWVWRVILLTLLFRRIAALDLRLVPSHPDRAGGLGFLEQLPFAFTPVVLAISGLVASREAHQVLYHGVRIETLKVEAVVLLVVLLGVFLSPLLALAPALGRAKRRARLEYAVLVGRMGGLLDRRWIRGEEVPDDPVLAAPEIGPMVDASAVYQAAKDMRAVPIGKEALLTIALPAMAPMIAVVAIEIPIKDILVHLAGALL